jgi:hypothetical protein
MRMFRRAKIYVNRSSPFFINETNTSGIMDSFFIVAKKEKKKTVKPIQSVNLLSVPDSTQKEGEDPITLWWSRLLCATKLPKPLPYTLNHLHI